MADAPTDDPVQVDTEQDLPVPPEIAELSKRQRSRTWKALQNAIQAKTKELWDEAKTLQEAANAVYGISDADKGHLKKILQSIRSVLAKYERILEELESLYREDKWGDSKEDAQFTREYSRTKIEYAHMAIKEVTDRLASIRDETTSQTSRASRKTTSSKASVSSSTARRKAMAEAAAAREQAEYDRAIAEKESQRRMLEAEEDRKREQRRAQYDLDMAILAANKATAMADARLNAIEQAIREDDTANAPLNDGDPADSEHRTEEWVRGLVDRPTETPYQVPRTGELDLSILQENRNRFCTPNAKGKPGNNSRFQDVVTGPKEEFGEVETEVRQITEELDALLPEYKTFIPPRGFCGNQPLYQPPLTGMAAVIATNQQLAASLARQSLPKCQPDTFDGDATLFHPWKTAFKAMIQDARLTPEQEMNYLRTYTKGGPQRLVDNFRKRQYRDRREGVRELWAELERRFGNSATITRALLDHLSKAAKFEERDIDKLQAFADLCSDVDSQLLYLPGLRCLNYAIAIQPIAEKLPTYLLSKWHRKVVRYAENHQDAYPGFHEFATLIQDQARLKNHPNVLATSHFQKLEKDRSSGEARRPRISLKFDSETSPRVLKSDTTPATGTVSETLGTPTSEKYCGFHERKGHDLTECKAFGRKTLEEKSDWIKTAGLCFRCQSNQHIAKDCKAVVKCESCDSDRHPTLLHKEKPQTNYGEELQSTCTTVCRDRGGVSCSKIVLIDVFSEEQPDQAHRVYAIVDDQSNASMISPELTDKLGVNGNNEKYFLSTCSGEKEVKYGRRASRIFVKSLDGKTSKLPTLVECDHIPQEKDEIPTPEMATRFPHLRDIAEYIPPIDPNAKVQILIGRDAPELMKVRAFKNGPNGAPWAQKLALGWTISGQVCLDRIGGPVHVTTCRTSVEQPTTTGNLTSYQVVPCKNQFRIRESYAENHQRQEIGDRIFQTSGDDNEVSTSWEDRRFMEIMKRGIHKNDRRNWEMPLPFRSQNVSMPNNRSQAVSRLNGLLRSFKRKPQLKEHYLEFMAKMLEREHAVPVPPERLQHTDSLGGANAVWYLPHFGVYHPKKPNQLRVVFDASAEYKGVSLNKELLTGPDQMNSLFGVLVRFRRESVAVMCDIEQMFHSFHVNPEHRDYLRFLWYRDNDPTKEIVEYHMTVHIFGNGPSPAIATYGLRKTADVGEGEFGAAAKEFVHKDFYVDDGLTSRPTEEETIKLIKSTQSLLATANLRLHKVVSNSISVMEALPAEDRAKNIRDLDLRHDALPAQRSLGVYWDLTKDSFTFRVSLPEKPFTRRGVLSIINSV